MSSAVVVDRLDDTTRSRLGPAGVTMDDPMMISPEKIGSWFRGWKFILLWTLMPQDVMAEIRSGREIVCLRTGQETGRIIGGERV